MEMARTIEVGRAVLASSTHHLELWLTTLITILPSQHSIDIQQLSSHTLITLLSSGSVWVGRGNGMHVDIDLTIRGESFPHQQLQKLGDSIASAPIWSQLGLEPTLPTDFTPRGRTIRININHCDGNDSLEAPQKHRIFSNVPAAHVQPPDGVPKFELQDVRFSMDILESKPRPQLKRSKTSPIERREDHIQHEGKMEGDEGSDVILSDMVSPTNTPRLEQVNTAPSVATLPANRKRRRPVAHNPTRITSSSVLFSTRGANTQRHLVAIATKDKAHLIPPKDEISEIFSMLDGAMRLSIFGLNKSSNGLKLKANTFGIGLADAIPNLWRPGYLAALSQRAHLLSTIARSCSQTAGVKATSVSLREKLRSLSSQPSPSAYDTQWSLTSAVDQQTKTLLSSISSRIWMHLQNNLSNRPALPLQAFVAHEAEVTNQSDSDAILDDGNVADGINGQVRLGMEDGEIACSANDDTTQHMTLVANSDVQMRLAIDREERLLDHEKTPVDIKDNLPVETPIAAAVTSADDGCQSSANVQQYESRLQLSRVIYWVNIDANNLNACVLTERCLSKPDEQSLLGPVITAHTLKEDLLFGGSTDTATTVRRA